MMYQSLIRFIPTSGDEPSGFNIESAVYSGKTFNIGAQEEFPGGLALSSDGTKLFITGYSTVYQYTLTTPFDISTTVYDTVTYNPPSASGAHGIAFKPDGTRMFLLSNAEFKVRDYHLNTPWNITTASPIGVSPDFVSQQSDSRGLALSSDGTKMYISGYTPADIKQFSLSTPYDVTTATYDNTAFSDQTSPTDIKFTSDGTKMFVSYYNNLVIRQYTLGTPWDLSTAVYDTVQFDVSNEASDLTGVEFSSDGLYMYTIGYDPNDEINQYNL